MPSFSYTSGSTGEVYDLNDPDGVLSGAAESVRGGEWSVRFGRRWVTSAARSVRPVKLRVHVPDPDRIDSLLAALDADVASMAPGTLAVGEWRQSACVTEKDVASVDVGGASASFSLTVALLDGEWVRPTSHRFQPASQHVSGTGLDLPCDLPCDLTALPPPPTVDVPGLVPCAVSIVIYGPATSPYITIGGNRYAVDAAVAAGGHLVLDGRSYRATLVSPTGGSTDVTPRRGAAPARVAGSTPSSASPPALRRCRGTAASAST